MPQAIPAIIAIVAEVAISEVVGLITASLQGSAGASPLLNSPTDTSPTSNSRTLSIRQSVAPRAVVLGVQTKGGAITFLGMSGANNETFHVVVTLSGHRIARIGQVYINGVAAIDENGNGIGQYAGLVAIEKKLGHPGEPAFPGLVAAGIGWTTAHRQDGCASVHLALTWNETAFAGFDPSQLSFDVWGHDAIYDPRTTIAGFTDNAALAAAWYLADSTFGLGDGWDTGINLDDAIAAANLADEYVDVNPTAAPFACDPNSAILTITEPFQPSSDSGIPSGLWAPLLGDKVQVSSTGLVPTGLAADTDYYYIPLGSVEGSIADGTSDTFTGRLAASLADALAQRAVGFSDIGTGTLTLTRIAERRYCANGVFTLDQAPSAALPALLTALGGSAGRAIWTGGQWSVKGGAYEEPVGDALDEDDLRKDGFTVLSQASLHDYCNTVRGKFINPGRGWQEDDYVAATNADLVAADGVEASTQLDLPFELSADRAQRIATMELLRARLELQIPQLPCKLTALTRRAGETVAFSFARYGWSERVFDITALALVDDQDDNQMPIKGVDLALRFTDPSAFVWSADQAQYVPIAPKSSLPDPSRVAAPGALSVAEQFFATKNVDGVQINAVLSAPVAADAYVRQYQFEWSPAGANMWTVLPRVAAPQGSSTVQATAYNLAVISYDFRVKAINGIGAESDYATLSGFAITPLPTPPAPTSFAVRQDGAVVVMSWGGDDDYTIDGIDIGFAPRGTTDRSAFQILTFKARGTEVTTAEVARGDWTFGAWFRNIGGDVGPIATADLVVTDTLTPLYSRDEAPGWTGDIENT